MDELRTRIERLERQNRLYRRVGAVTLVAVVALAAAAWTSPDQVVRTRTIELTDLTDDVRVVMDANGVRFFDSEGVPRMTFAMEAGSCPCITLRTADDKPLAALGAMANNLVILNLRDKEGSPRLRLGVNPDGEPFWETLDKDGERVFTGPPK